MRLVCLALLICCVGCLPSTRVTKNPCDNNKGIRYYRPKPWLLIKPHTDKDNENPSDKFVDIELQMLPDFSEEYSINIRSGLGSNNTSVTLADGWNLTAINVNVDSNFDENFEAVADGISKFVPTAKGDQPRLPGSTVSATNVPLGYYEAVISAGADGKKRMYGWRYVGFSPYAYCPQETCGVDCQPDCQHRELFGLVFENGVMTFKELHSTRHANNMLQDSNLNKALKFLENEVARAVPGILQGLEVAKVSAKDIDIATDAEDTIDVNAVLTTEQMAAYKTVDATDYEIAQSIAEVIKQQTGQELDITFRVTPQDD